MVWFAATLMGLLLWWRWKVTWCEVMYGSEVVGGNEVMGGNEWRSAGAVLDDIWNACHYVNYCFLVTGEWLVWVNRLLVPWFSKLAQFAFKEFNRLWVKRAFACAVVFLLRLLGSIVFIIHKL